MKYTMGTTISVKKVETAMPKIKAQASPEKMGSRVMDQAASMAPREVRTIGLVRKAPASRRDFTSREGYWKWKQRHMDEIHHFYMKDTQYTRWSFLFCHGKIRG
jgi:hypothetical protein